MKKFLTFFILIALILGGWLYFRAKSPEHDEGSTENGESEEVLPDGWQASIKSELGMSFGHPEDIKATYVTAVDWPPDVNLLEKPYQCIEAGEEIERAGETREEVISGRPYCVTRVSEGAAGSVYTEYAYLTELENRTYAFTFSLRRVQCANYDEPYMSECRSEQEGFDVSGMVNEIVNTVTFKDYE